MRLGTGDRQDGGAMHCLKRPSADHSACSGHHRAPTPPGHSSIPLYTMVCVMETVDMLAIQTSLHCLACANGMHGL